MIALRITQPATLHRYSKGAKDALGDVQPTFVDVPVYVELQEQTTTEVRNGSTELISSWLCYFRPDVDLSGFDEVTIDGSRYSFQGDPWKVRHPRLGTTSHWLSRLRKVT